MTFGYSNAGRRGALYGDFDAPRGISCPVFQRGAYPPVVTVTSLPRRAHRRVRAVAAAVALGLLLVGCGGGSPGAVDLAATGAPAAGASSDGAGAGATSGASPGVVRSPGDIDPALLEPLTMLGPCNVEPNALDEEPADGTLLPEGAVLTSQTRQGPLTQIKGYIPMTPVQIRVFYQRQDQYEYEILQVEDEIRESEVLLADGDNRLFVKAQAICELGSVFLAVLAPESSGDQVPVPAGGGGG